MQVLILGAEGPGKGYNSNVPACLQPMKGATNLLDQQIRILNLCGIQTNSIYVVIGSQGSWASVEAKNKIAKYPQENIIVSNLNDKTTSESSFYLALSKIDVSGPLLVINSDSVFDTRHIEALINNQNVSCVLTKTATSINDRGIKILTDKQKILALAPPDTFSVFPWDLYAGLCLLSMKSLLSIKDSEEKVDTAGFLYSISQVLDIGEFKNISYHQYSNGYENYSNSLDLRGGSFASLARKHLVRKEAKGQGVEKLTWEIDWLMQLPQNLKPYFPAVIDTNRTDDHAWFDMPWYELSNLRKNILTGAYDSIKACDFAEQVLDFMFAHVYTNEVDESPADDCVIKKHILRVKNRVDETVSVAPCLASMVTSPTIVINGKTLLNIPSALLEISKRPILLELLNPKQLRMIHGDLHFQNILVGPTDSGLPFLLADPRGELKGSDLYYDMGKLWHSFNGLYDLIHTDLYSVGKTVAGEGSFYYLNFQNTDLLRTYAAIKGIMSVLLPSYPLIGSDPNWLLKTLFAESMHFCSVMAFHIHGTAQENRATALYLRGVELINEFLCISDYRKYPVSDEIVGRYELDSWAKNLLEHYAHLDPASVNPGSANICNGNPV